MPRSRSIFIQSERVVRRSRLALTWPARLMAPPNSRSFSVSVVLPASGWEIKAGAGAARILQIEKDPRHHDARPSLNGANEAGNVGFGPEHCGRSAVSLPTLLVHQERSGIMSDPRYTDPRRNDQWRRSEGSSGGANIWPWIAAALVALGALGLLYGYNRTEQASTQQPT